MSSKTDIKLAKQALSGRLLRAGLRRGPVAQLMAMTVSQAIDNSGSNTHAVGIGVKVVEGKATKQPCVRVHVTQKIAESLIPPRDLIPKEIDGIPTDVIESPPAMIQAARPKKSAKKSSASRKPAENRGEKGATAAAQKTCSQKRRQRQHPVVGGTSAAQFEVTAGTIACFCRSTKQGDDPDLRYVLSNNHVFANVNRARIGDDIYLPAALDGGTDTDTIAKLHRFIELKIGGFDGNRVDAAIGEMLADVQFNNSICMIGSISGTIEATVNMKVRKHGRTSGYTEGEITDLEYDAIVGMDHQDPTVQALFHDQLRIEAIQPYPAIGLGGDSGSLVVQKSGQKAVGLYFAGPSSGSYGIANQIANVLSELEIALV